jgi:putative membrane protein
LNRWKVGAAAALLVGVALTVGAILYVGAGDLWRSVQRIGLGGFAIYVLYNLLVFLPLGWAWWSVAPGVGGRGAVIFPWGRLVRESASDVLPFSQVGGLLAGIGAVRQRGVSEPLSIASQIVDLVTEMAAQLVYTLFGVAMLTALLSHATEPRQLLWTAILAVVVGVATLAAFIALQGRGLDLIGNLAGRWLKDVPARAEAAKAVLRDIYGRPRRLFAGFLLHVAGWVMSGAGSWMALRWMGVEVELWKVLTLEGLMAAVRSVAFMTPGGLGFQESAYVLIAPLFGLTAESTLAVSLLRRAKDLLVGVVAILAWQYLQLVARRRAKAPTLPSRA